MSDQNFVFSAAAKRKTLLIGVAGIVVLIAGIIALNMGHHGHGEGEAAGHHFHWLHRVFTNLWINNVYFAGIGVIGVFFVAIQYAAQAGWSAYIKRIPEAFGYWVPIAGLLTLVLFFVINYAAPHHWHLFHWLDSSLYDPDSANYDPIIAGKEGYLNLPFYLGRTAVYFIVWTFMFFLIRRQSVAEDLSGGNEYWSRLRVLSTIFIIVFAVTSSTAAWDWVMSIDTHWFSTMFGWYNFSSWFVAGVAAITLVVIFLHDAGYLPELNYSHLHDLGKFVFAFSIFWTYIWFSQFLLIYYANIPEESVYFVERLKSDQYAPIFYLNIFLNFIFPFLFLMTRDAKRLKVWLKIACIVVIIGHWFDFYLMITPGSLQQNGGVGLIELGTFMIFLSAFVYVLALGLTKASLVARNHPMLEESLHHHI